MSTRTMEIMSRVIPTRPTRSWAYAGESGERDLRVDFLRGVAVFVLLIIHLEFFSAFNLAAWERVGIICAADLFVVLAGFVLGGVYRRRLPQEGLGAASWRLWARAAQLYRVNVFMILLVALLAQVPLWDASSITTFVDRGSGVVYPLYPGHGVSLQQWVGRLVLLRMGPHQLQILGLYMALFVISPAALYFLAAGRTRWLLALSWGAYLFRWVEPVRITGAQFEYGFPLLTWQLIFFHGLAAGYHREELLAFYSRHRAAVLGVALLVAGSCLFLAQNTTNPFVPAYARMSLIPGEVYNLLHEQYFSKNEQGPLRILNNAALLIVAGELLTRAWVPLRAAFGWFLLPLGQASLYVFIMHVFVVLAIANVIPFGFSKESPPLLVNTLAHAACLALLWLLVRYKVLFRWVPR
jgi:hypothetical protein